MKNIFLVLIFSFGATLLFGQKEEARIVNGAPAPFHWFDHLGPNLGVRGPCGINHNLLISSNFQLNSIKLI